MSLARSAAAARCRAPRDSCSATNEPWSSGCGWAARLVLVPAVVVGLKRRAACRCEAVRPAGSGGLYVDEDGALNTDPHPAVRALVEIRSSESWLVGWAGEVWRKRWAGTYEVSS